MIFILRCTCPQCRRNLHLPSRRGMRSDTNPLYQSLHLARIATKSLNRHRPRHAPPGLPKLLSVTTFSWTHYSMSTQSRNPPLRHSLRLHPFRHPSRQHLHTCLALLRAPRVCTSRQHPLRDSRGVYQIISRRRITHPQTPHFLSISPMVCLPGQIGPASVLQWSYGQRSYHHQRP